MRRLLFIGVLATSAASGCTLTGLGWLPERSTAPAVPPTLKEAPPRPVQPEDVNRDNVRQQLRALQQELDWDLEGKD